MMHVSSILYIFSSLCPVQTFLNLLKPSFQGLLFCLILNVGCISLTIVNSCPWASHVKGKKWVVGPPVVTSSQVSDIEICTRSVEEVMSLGRAETPGSKPDLLRPALRIPALGTRKRSLVWCWPEMSRITLKRLLEFLYFQWSHPHPKL